MGLSSFAELVEKIVTICLCYFVTKNRSLLETIAFSLPIDFIMNYVSRKIIHWIHEPKNKQKKT